MRVLVQSDPFDAAALLSGFGAGAARVERTIPSSHACRSASWLSNRSITVVPTSSSGTPAWRNPVASSPTSRRASASSFVRCSAAT